MKTLKQILRCSTVLLVSACPQAWAQLIIPNTFTAGTPAVAVQVNQNFTAVATAVNSGAGVEFANDGSLTAIGIVDTTVATIDVTVPATGFLIANSMGSATCTNPASFFVRLHNTTTAISTSAILGENRPTGGQIGYYSITYVFAVNAGVNTLNVTGSCTAGGGSMTALTLNAIFVPTRY
jgi:hypothetical protein